MTKDDRILLRIVTVTNSEEYFPKSVFLSFTAFPGAIFSSIYKAKLISFSRYKKKVLTEINRTAEIYHRIIEFKGILRVI